MKIQCQDRLTILGVTLDPKLTFNLHIDKITAKANSLTYLFTKIRKYLNVDQSTLTYKSIIRPTLEYCPSILLVIPIQYRKKIERSQNIAIRIILHAPRHFSITSGRLILNIPTIESRRIVNFHKFVNKKMIKGQASQFMLQILNTMTKHTRSLRTCSPYIKPSFRTNFGKASLPTLVYTALTTKNPQLLFS